MYSKQEPRQTNSLSSVTSVYTHYRYHGPVAHVFSGSSASKAADAACSVNPTTRSTLINELCVRRSYSAGEQLLSSVDAHGQTTRFWADALGNASLIEDPHGNLTAANHNSLGHRIELFDPNMGHWQFSYNGLGELLNQTDAKGQTTLFEYDPLGCLTRRISNGSGLATAIDRW